MYLRIVSNLECIIVVWFRIKSHFFMFVQISFNRWQKRRIKKNSNEFRNKRGTQKIATWNCQRVIFWYIKVNTIRLHTNTKTPTVKLFSLFHAFHFDAALYALFFSLILIFSTNNFWLLNFLLFYLVEFHSFFFLSFFPWKFSIYYITAKCILKYFFKPLWNKIAIIEMHQWIEAQRFCEHM